MKTLVNETNINVGDTVIIPGNSINHKQTLIIEKIYGTDIDCTKIRHKKDVGGFTYDIKTLINAKTYKMETK